MAPAALAVSVSLVSISLAGNWDRVSVLTRHYFLTYIIATDWNQDFVNVLSWASVSRHFIGKCQALIYLNPVDMSHCQARALPSA